MVENIDMMGQAAQRMPDQTEDNGFRKEIMTRLRIKNAGR